MHRLRNLRPLLKTPKLSGVCFEKQLLCMLLIVVDVISVLEGQKVSEKRTPWWIQEAKRTICAKKWPIGPGL